MLTCRENKGPMTPIHQLMHGPHTIEYSGDGASLPMVQSIEVSKSEESIE